MQLIPFQFDPGTVGLVLEGLDLLPHGRVRNTYDSIRGHAEAYLREQAQPPAPPEMRPAEASPQVRRLRAKDRKGR